MSAPTPPVARVEPVEITQFGHTRIDPYQWMKDPNWQEALRDPKQLDPAIRSHLEAERAYADAVLEATTGDLADRLYEELVGRMQQDESTVPFPDGPWEYYRRYREGGEHPLLCRRPTGGGEEQILLDGDERAEGLAFYGIGAASHSPDHSMLMLSEDDTGNEDYVLRIRNADTGEWLADTIERVYGGAVWVDNERLLYAVRDDAFRPRWVKVHVLGSDPADDPVVYEGAHEGFFISPGRMLSGEYVYIHGSDHDTSEVRVARTDDPDLEFTLIAARDQGVEYYPEHHGDRFLIRTNLDAVDFRIVEAPVASPGREHWTDVIPHESGRLIEGFIPFSQHLVRLVLQDALPRIVIRSLADGSEQTLAFDEEAYSLGIQSGYEQDTTDLRFTYSSMSTPQRTYDIDLTTGERTLRKEQVIPSGHDPSHYVVRRTHATSHDGETVPVTILHHKDTPVDGSAAAVLYGYGAYGYSMPAGFSPHRFSVVDRGFVYALAHIRGGSDKGYAWYADGSQHDRPNTHHDFIAAGEHLVSEGYTSTGRIACHGRSAGGLLVGAVANMRPDLWGLVMGDVPFVDALNTMSDTGLPLTPPEWPLWGNPLEDEAAYETIAGYSPYDNIAEVPYPPFFVTAGVSDPRVTYWEAAKWVARLRATMTNDAPVLFHVNVDAGHFGDAGRFGHLKEDAARIAFLLHVLG